MNSRTNATSFMYENNKYDIESDKMILSETYSKFKKQSSISSDNYYDFHFGTKAESELTFIEYTSESRSLPLKKEVLPLKFNEVVKLSALKPLNTFVQEHEINPTNFTPQL